MHRIGRVVLTDRSTHERQDPVVVAVVADPYPSVRTRSAVEELLAGASDAGATTSIIETSDGTLDDEQRARIEGADGVVLASPTYRATAAWPLKRLLDETERSTGTAPHSPLRGKAVQTILTGASDHHFLGSDPIRAVLSGFFAAQLLSPGLYFAASSFTPEKTPEDDEARILRAHGRALVELARTVRGNEAFEALFPLV